MHIVLGQKPFKLIGAGICIGRQVVGFQTIKLILGGSIILSHDILPEPLHCRTDILGTLPIGIFFQIRIQILVQITGTGCCFFLDAGTDGFHNAPEEAIVVIAFCTVIPVRRDCGVGFLLVIIGDLTLALCQREFSKEIFPLDRNLTLGILHRAFQVKLCQIQFGMRIF